MAENILHHEENRGIHRLVMDHGPNALDRELMEALQTEIHSLARLGNPAFILASAHPTLFCPGWNLKLLAEAGRQEVAGFLDAFNALLLDLFSYPGPTAVEIRGHAVAAGCQIAVACDLRVMAAGQPRLGLSELNLGVPLPSHSLRVLKTRLSSSALDDLVLRGEGCSAERARELGIVHRVAGSDDLPTLTAVEIGRLAARPQRAFVETKRLLCGRAWAAMGRGEPDADAAFLDCWFEEETRERIAGVASRLSS